MRFKKGMIPWNKGTKGVMKPSSTSFKKGHISWSKGTKGIMKSNSGSFKKGNKVNLGRKGYHLTKEHIEKISKSLKGKPRPWAKMLGSKNPTWKGDKAGYSALHTWIKRHKGIPKECKSCGVKRRKKMIHWANISHKYKRKLNDFIALCVKCHSKYDRGLLILPPHKV